MSVQEQKLTAIAEAIREKEGSTEPIPAADFASRILALPSSSLPEGVRTINVTSSDPEMGTVSGGGVASDGMTVTVSAQGIYGNLFEEWQENQIAVSKEKEYIFSVAEDRELTALFVDYQMNWTETTLSENWKYWSSVAYGNGVFVTLIGSSYSSNEAAYSMDGITWVKTTMPYTMGWNSVAFGEDKFVAVGANGWTTKAAYSTDGIEWKEITMPLTNYWQSVAYGNGRFVAVGGYASSNKAAYSDDGITWKPCYMPSSQKWWSVTYGDGKFVAVVGGSNNFVTTAAYSTDGITWKETELPFKSSWNSVIYGDGKFVAVGGNSASVDKNKIVSSIDGITWHEVVLPTSATWNSITYGNGKFVAISYNDKTVYSTDGITWRETTMPSSGDWISITYGDGKFVAVRSGSTVGAYALG